MTTATDKLKTGQELINESIDLLWSKTQKTKEELIAQAVVFLKEQHRAQAMPRRTSEFLCRQVSNRLSEGRSTLDDLLTLCRSSGAHVQMLIDIKPVFVPRRISGYPIRYDDGIDKVPDLPAVIKERLRKAGVLYLGQLVRMKPEGILEIKGIGSTYAQRVIKAVHGAGLDFWMDTATWIPPHERKDEGMQKLQGDDLLCQDLYWEIINSSVEKTQQQRDRAKYALDMKQVGSLKDIKAELGLK